MCPPKWQYPFNLTQGFIPQNLHCTLDILENVEQRQETSKILRKPNGKSRDIGKSEDKNARCPARTNMFLKSAAQIKTDLECDDFIHVVRMDDNVVVL